MKSLIFLSCFVSVVFAASYSSSRIVGGMRAKPGQFKYQVSLHRAGNFFCGGSIIGPTKILTAAHCVLGSNIPITVIVGSTKLSQPGTSYKVKLVATHEEFNPVSYAYDLAVLTLEKPIVYNENVQPIALATSDPAEGTRATVSGWGRTNRFSAIPDNLQYIVVEILDRIECRTRLGSSGPQYVCSSNGPCRGDSGAPLVDGNGDQVGVVSGGGLCDDDAPTLYASVPYNRAWIVSS